ncbi:MAG: hypothetical protein DDT33_01252 [Firmicutes bacterium]|nr:hypothetical protein [Bacillota bacterium]
MIKIDLARTIAERMNIYTKDAKHPSQPSPTPSQTSLTKSGEPLRLSLGGTSPLRSCITNPSKNKPYPPSPYQVKKQVGLSAIQVVLDIHSLHSDTTGSISVKYSRQPTPAKTPQPLPYTHTFEKTQSQPLQTFPAG